jgi:hypothetical protein
VPLPPLGIGQVLENNQARQKWWSKVFKAKEMFAKMTKQRGYRAFSAFSLLLQADTLFSRSYGTSSLHSHVPASRLAGYFQIVPMGRIPLWFIA